MKRHKNRIYVSELNEMGLVALCNLFDSGYVGIGSDLPKINKWISNSIPIVLEFESGDLVVEPSWSGPAPTPAQERRFRKEFPSRKMNPRTTFFEFIKPEGYIHDAD
jgi:hypothetical protein